MNGGSAADAKAWCARIISDALAIAWPDAADAAVVLVALDVPARTLNAAGEAIGRAGFTVERVDVVGIRNMDSAPVYEIALDQKSMAMPLVDADAIREAAHRLNLPADNIIELGAELRPEMFA